jgi:cleavage and polyadenylation specificity factor subunit 1
VSERLFIATLDGGLGYIMPVPEKTYRRLLMLQNVLVSQGAHIAGLNPKAFRTYKSWKKLQTNPARSVIDGELVYNYLHLSIPEKLEVTGFRLYLLLIFNNDFPGL